MLNINKYMGSGKFYIFLEDSNNFQNLLKASIGMGKKFWTFLQDSRTLHKNTFLISR